MPDENAIGGGTPPPTTAPAAEAPPEPKALFYVLSFFIPIAGIILGAIYLSKPEEDNKKFGKNCLVWALAAIGAVIMCYCAFIGFYVSFIIVYVIIIMAVVIAAAGAGAAKMALPFPPFHHR
jgi:hypothetical protein